MSRGVMAEQLAPTLAWWPVSLWVCCASQEGLRRGVLLPHLLGGWRPPGESSQSRGVKTGNLPLSVGSRCPLGSTMSVMGYWGGVSCSCASSADGSLLERCACRRLSDSGGDCYTECDSTRHYGKGSPPQRPNWRSGGPERCPCMGVSGSALAMLRLRSTGALVQGQGRNNTAGLHQPVNGDVGYKSCPPCCC